MNISPLLSNLTEVGPLKDLSNLSPSVDSKSPRGPEPYPVPAKVETSWLVLIFLIT